ncbi:MAG: preprotein translocase subunit SecG [Gammaproteobacteria bacterium]|nr:preprotein translocase subunit SecG [Gammaproteobacteria bacterium]
MLQTVLLVVHILVAISLIAIILLQQGRGATAGAAFGSGASSTVFGARGSASFLSRATAILALVFFGNCLTLAFLATRQSAPASIGQQLEEQVQPNTPPSVPVPTAPAPSAPISDLPQIPAPTP